MKRFSWAEICRLLGSLVVACSFAVAASGKPALEAGLPMDLPRAEAVDGARLDVPPRLVKRGRGVYPEHLVYSGNYVRGSVEARVEISSDGAVKSVKVLHASHPAFVAATTAQLTESKFSPALRDGNPVAAYGIFQAGFDVQGRFGESVGGGVIMIPAKSADLPPELDYDWPPIMKEYCEPVFLSARK